jgi:hypothetical protein
MADVRRRRRSEPRLSVKFKRGVAAVAALLFPQSARGAPTEIEPVTLLYETRANATCPSQDEFFATVRAYASRWAPVPDGTPTERTLHVRLVARGAETVGTLVVANATETLSERRIVGPTCAGVARAMAIMVGVALDSPREPSSHTAPSDTKPAPSDTKPAPSDTKPAPSDTKPAALLPEPRGERPVLRRPSSSVAAVAPAPRAPDSSLAFDVRVESTSAVVRGALPAVAASMKLAFLLGESRWPHGWKPSLGLGVRQSFPKERALRGGSVDFLWTAGNLRACPHEVTVAALATLSPCAEMNIGVLRADAEGFANARQTSITWLDVGGSMWAAVSLSKSLFLSSTILVSAPLLRRPFVLASGAVAASVPAIGLLGGLGIGTRM